MRDSYVVHNEEKVPIGWAYLSPDVNAGYENRWILNHISVRYEFRGKGYGDSLMQQVCEDADRERVLLWLGVQPMSDRVEKEDYARLVRWYTWYKFTPQRGYIKCSGALPSPMKSGHVCAVHNIMERYPDSYRAAHHHEFYPFYRHSMPRGRLSGYRFCSCGERSTG